MAAQTGLPSRQMTLQDIADQVRVRIDKAQEGTASRDILVIIATLIETLQANAGPDPRDAEINALRAKVVRLDTLLNNDAQTFLEIKTALGNPNLTQGQLADEIRTKWRRI